MLEVFDGFLSLSGAVADAGVAFEDTFWSFSGIILDAFDEDDDSVPALPLDSF